MSRAMNAVLGGLATKEHGLHNKEETATEIGRRARRRMGGEAECSRGGDQAPRLEVRMAEMEVA